MRKLFSVVMFVLPLLAGCENLFRDEIAQLHKEVNAVNERLDQLCDVANQNITALQVMVSALQENDYVEDVAPILENGVEVGYRITFVKSGAVTIYHGKDGVDGSNGIDGADGKDGVDGKDGYVPNIGLKQDADGVWYWTLDGGWLLDSEDNKVKAVGIDGQNGASGTNGTNGITPQLKIESGYWYVSYDNGKTWGDTPLGQATGDKGDSIFSDIDCSNEDYIILTLSNGESIELSLRGSDVQGVLSTVQSVTYVPKYSDGRIRVKDEIAELDFQIFPKSSVSKVAKNWQSLLSVKALYTITRAVTFVDLPILSCSADETNGVITITVSCANLNVDYYYGAQSVNASLSLSNDNSEIVSEYIPFAPYYQPNEVWYTSTDGKIVTPNVSEPFNVAIVSNTYKNGKGVIKLDGDLTTIAKNAFKSKKTLSSVMIPHKVTSIDDSAFGSCTSLMKIYCKPLTRPSVYLYYRFYYESLSSTKRGVFEFNSGMKIYVPAESYKTYTSFSGASTSNSDKLLEDNWGVYTSYMEPLYLLEK